MNKKRRHSFEVAELELQPIADEELQSVLGMEDTNNVQCGGDREHIDEGSGGSCAWYCPWYPPEG